MNAVIYICFQGGLLVNIRMDAVDLSDFQGGVLVDICRDAVLAICVLGKMCCLTFSGGAIRSI